MSLQEIDSFFESFLSDSSSRRKEEGRAIEKGKSHPKGAKDGYSSGKKGFL